MSSRYPQITPLPQASLFKIEPDCYSDYMCPNVDYSGNNDMLLPSLFSSEMYSPYVGYEQDMYSLPSFTVPSNTSPYSPTFFASELPLNNCSPGLSAKDSSPTTFDFSHMDSLNSPPQFIPDTPFVNLTNPDVEAPLITAKPTPRALKAKRCPTNKCGCGGKKNCANPLCAKAVGCFTCPVCGIEFSRKNSMRRHVLTHINLRPYECRECNKSFYRSDIYKRHLLSKRCKRNVSQNQTISNCP